MSTITIRMGAAFNGPVQRLPVSGLVSATMHRPPEPLRPREAPEAFLRRNSRFLNAASKFARELCAAVGITAEVVSLPAAKPSSPHRKRKPRRKVPAQAVAA